MIAGFALILLVAVLLFVGYNLYLCSKQDKEAHEHLKQQIKVFLISLSLVLSVVGILIFFS